jgi:hypothetical protein
VEACKSAPYAESCVGVLGQRLLDIQTAIASVSDRSAAIVGAPGEVDPEALVAVAFDAAAEAGSVAAAVFAGKLPGFNAGLPEVRRELLRGDGERHEEDPRRVGRREGWRRRRGQDARLPRRRGRGVLHAHLQGAQRRRAPRRVPEDAAARRHLHQQVEAQAGAHDTAVSNSRSRSIHAGGPNLLENIP